MLQSSGTASANLRKASAILSSEYAPAQYGIALMVSRITSSFDRSSAAIGCFLRDRIFSRKGPTRKPAYFPTTTSLPFASMSTASFHASLASWTIPRPTGRVVPRHNATGTVDIAALTNVSHAWAFLDISGTFLIVCDAAASCLLASPVFGATPAQ